ncbi:MAG: SDR family oxidoreductase [Leptolyngbya sp. UWPOB_LEPTO1]|nr:SDR family oxidoreductase [Leptolyngbya sp. UWPOB_LEPTO1]
MSDEIVRGCIVFQDSQMILVTGATGSNGTEIVKRLTAQNVQVRAMVRNHDRAKEIALPNVEVVEGNFDRPETLLEALTEVDRAFLLTNSTEHAEAQQLAFVDAAKQSGVKHIVKLSQFAANADSPVRFLRYHAAVEAAIQASGMTYTFLRPNLFMQGLLNFRSTITSQNAFYAAIDNAKVSVVDVRDIADVAVAALTETGHEGKIYNLTGPQALTHAEMAEQLSAALNRQIAFVDIPSEAMRDQLLNIGMPAWQADGLIEDYAHYRRNEAAAIASGIEDATGKAPRQFKDFARDYATAFS